jgi:hypothetical protein
MAAVAEVCRGGKGGGASGGVESACKTRVSSGCPEPRDVVAVAATARTSQWSLQANLNAIASQQQQQ